jgi:hypothetical protein
MTALLRQPGGFEGFGVIPEDVHADDLALPQGEDAGELHVRLRALTRSAPDIADYHPVGGVDEVHHWLQRVVLPSVAQLLDFAEDRLPAHRGAWLRPSFDVVHDHIGVEKVTEKSRRASASEQRPHGPDWRSVQDDSTCDNLVMAAVMGERNTEAAIHAHRHT